jgi:hypothetical protein
MAHSNRTGARVPPDSVSVFCGSSECRMDLLRIRLSSEAASVSFRDFVSLIPIP